MSYTLEQMALASIGDQLWWRLPAAKDGSEEWSIVSHDFAKVTPEDLQHPDAVYFIGPTPPRVLSELEGELLDALKELHERLTQSVQLGLTAEEAYDSFYQDVVQSAISKATP